MGAGGSSRGPPSMDAEATGLDGAGCRSKSLEANLRSAGRAGTGAPASSLSPGRAAGRRIDAGPGRRAGPAAREHGVLRHARCGRRESLKKACDLPACVRAREGAWQLRVCVGRPACHDVREAGDRRSTRRRSQTMRPGGQGRPAAPSSFLSPGRAACRRIEAGPGRGAGPAVRQRGALRPCTVRAAEEPEVSLRSACVHEGEGGCMAASSARA
jgi:hypothetical protein